MDVRTGPKHRDTGAGFTLVELLLTVALLVLLLGAVVYNFSGLQRGAPLDEGVNQVEALIRFARAHAAYSGRQVQITFEEEAGDGLAVSLGNLGVFWEPDPVVRPGIFEPLREAEEFVRGIHDLIIIEGVRWVEGDSFASGSVGSPIAVDKTAGEDPIPVMFPPIGFYPDGSSDSAELIVTSRSEEDSRHIAVRLQGITGSIRHKLIANELKPAELEPPPPPANDLNTMNAHPAP